MLSVTTVIFRRQKVKNIYTNCSWMEFVTESHKKLFSLLLSSSNFVNDTRSESGGEKLINRSRPSEGQRSVLLRVSFRTDAREHIACYILSQRLQINWCGNIRKRHRRESICRFYPITFAVVVRVETFFIYSKRNAREKSSLFQRLSSTQNIFV